MNQVEISVFRWFAWLLFFAGLIGTWLLIGATITTTQHRKDRTTKQWVSIGFSWFMPTLTLVLAIILLVLFFLYLERENSEKTQKNLERGLSKMTIVIITMSIVGVVVTLTLWMLNKKNHTKNVMIPKYNETAFLKFVAFLGLALRGFTLLLAIGLIVVL